MIKINKKTQLGYDIPYNVESIYEYAAYTSDGKYKYLIKELTDSEEDIYIKVDYFCDKFKNVDKIKVELSPLCEIMIKSDKSPLYQNENKHCFSPMYYKLFKDIKNEHLNVLEIGTSYGHSIAGWRTFFPNSKIYGWDNNKNFLVKVHKIVPDAILSVCDISKPIESNIVFDIIIDDSSHAFNDQINIINSLYKNTKKYLIIEDVFLHISVAEFDKHINQEVKDQFDYKFIYPYIDGYEDTYDNNVLLIFTKK